MAFLTAESFDLADGHAFDADFAQGILDLFEFEWFDDRFNFFHCFLVFERRSGQPRRNLRNLIARTNGPIKSNRIRL
jgi:hypothetical protein